VQYSHSLSVYQYGHVLSNLMFIRIYSEIQREGLWLEGEETILRLDDFDCDGDVE